MLSRLTRTLRRRAAVIAAVFYALCSMAPALALTPKHLLAGHHHGAAIAHVHDDGNTHSHPDQGTSSQHSDGDGNGLPGFCCGLFCLTALPATADLSVAQPIAHRTLAAASQEFIVGRGPDRIDRPPIVLLSL
jgi:hypothetical protein